MGDWNEVDKITKSSSKDFDDVIKEVEYKLNHLPPKKHVRVDYREFEQFKKSWFYRNWENRFKRLGSIGVIAIPNTTFQDWIVWLYEWSIKFTDDYNEFKKLVFEAIKLHEEHLKILDNRVDDLEMRVEEIERQIALIWEKINDILNKITQIENNINNLQQQINELKANNEKLNKIIQNLINSGAWNPDTNDFYPDRDIATGNINFFGGATDDKWFIRTNNGQTENDVTAGI